MGGGGSKKKQMVQPPILQKELTIPEEEEEEEVQIQSPPQSPPLLSRRSSVQNRQASLVHSPVPSPNSRASSKRSVTALTNGTDRRPTFGELDSNRIRQNNDTSLPPIINPLSDPKSRSLSRTSSVFLPPPIGGSRTGSHSLSQHHKHSHRQSSGALHGQIGRCSHCPHCLRANGRGMASTPIPKWITENHQSDDRHIIMDEYDAVAVKKKIISEHGHLPGSYDYRPYLTMEQTDDNDQTNEQYYTQPTVATTKPSPTKASHTPYPEYVFLQRREQRLNKPYSLSLFD